MKSLFLRMRVIHWVGIFLLIANALIFTDNIISIIIQLTIAVVILVHDIDEKINGVNVAKKIIDNLSNFNAETSIDIELNYSEEYSNMIRLINKFRDEVKKAVEVNSLSNQITNSISNLEKSMIELEKAFGTSLKLSNDVKWKLETIKRSSNSNLESSEEISKNLESASNKINMSIKEMEDLEEVVTKSSESNITLSSNLDSLISNAEDIKGILNIISDISDKINLLALNAAIEAARAGEHGQGFAVVADEVRKLAEKTKSSLSNINSSICIIVQNIAEASGNLSLNSANFNNLSEISTKLRTSLLKTNNELDSAKKSSNEDTKISEQISKEANDSTEKTNNQITKMKITGNSVEIIKGDIQKIKINISELLNKLSNI